MKVQTETIATREVLLTIEPDEDVIRSEMRNAARRVSRWRPVPGFRPGKAPYEMVERIFGRELLLNEALQEAGPRIYGQAIDEAGIEPYEQGQLEIESQEPLVLKVNVALVPQVDLGDYQSLRVDPEPEVSISEEQIAAELAAVQRRHAEYNPVERPAEMGDQLVASIVGKAEDEEVVNQQGRTITLSDELMPPGFGEALVGMSAGEKREFTLTYPDDYTDEDLAGKNVAFDVSLETVREVKLPEADDDLAKAAGDYETLDDLRDGLAKNLKERLEAQAQRREQEAAITGLVERASVEYPAVAVEHEIDSIIGGQRAQLEQMGFAFENYLRMVGQTEAELREQARAEAQRRLVNGLVLSEYARVEDLNVSADELEERVNAMAAAYGEQAEEIKARMLQGRTALGIYSQMMTEKAIEALVAKATGRLVVEAETGSEPAAGTDQVVEADAEAAVTEGEDE